MVIENLQITSFMEWLLGSGWDKAVLWQPLGIVVLLVVVVGGGLALLLSLRHGPPHFGPTSSLLLGSLLGALSLSGLVLVGFCSTQITRELLNHFVGQPLFFGLKPLLGEGWIDGAIYTWLSVAAALSGVIYFICWLAAILLHGPVEGTRRCGGTVADIAADLARISSRRVFALAWLAVRESVRRRVVVVFIVFVGLILFAALFIKSDSPHPAQLYIQIVLNFTIYLAMLFALVLSALSLPADIRDRTLHTVVTKPVRKIEIVLGRVVGFVFVGTVLLALIGAISYGFTVRGLTHTHKLTRGMLQAETLPGGRGTLLRGSTTRSHGHEHEVTIIERPGEEPEATVDAEQDHTHDLYVSGSGDKAVYTLGPPKDLFQARVPIYGKLKFTDDAGAEGEGHQRGRRVDLPQLHPRADPRLGDLDFQRPERGRVPEIEVPRRHSHRDDHRGLPHP